MTQPLRVEPGVAGVLTRDVMRAAPIGTIIGYPMTDPHNAGSQWTKTDDDYWTLTIGHGLVEGPADIIHPGSLMLVSYPTPEVRIDTAAIQPGMHIRIDGYDRIHVHRVIEPGTFDGVCKLAPGSAWTDGVGEDTIDTWGNLTQGQVTVLPVRDLETAQAKLRSIIFIEGEERHYDRYDVALAPVGSILTRSRARPTDGEGWVKQDDGSWLLAGNRVRDEYVAANWYWYPPEGQVDASTQTFTQDQLDEAVQAALTTERTRVAAHYRRALDEMADAFNELLWSGV